MRFHNASLSWIVASRATVALLLRGHGKSQPYLVIGRGRSVDQAGRLVIPRVAAFCSRAFYYLREPVIFEGDLKHAFSDIGRTHCVGPYPCLFRAGAPVRRILNIGVRWLGHIA